MRPAQASAARDDQSTLARSNSGTWSRLQDRCTSLLEAGRLAAVRLAAGRSRWATLTVGLVGFEAWRGNQRCDCDTAGVADFSQAGSVPTLHDLGHRPVSDLEAELRGWSSQRHTVLVLPCLASEIGTVSLKTIVEQLADTDWLAGVVVGLDNADESDWRRACALLKQLPQRHAVLWNDSPLMSRVEARLYEHGLAPRLRGKGRNVWYCLGALLADARADVVVMHDADIVDYKREMVARLAYPVMHPAFGYRFAKGYYPRITHGHFGGRVTRLLVAPLLHALRDWGGASRYLSYLEAFRYPLAGETAMDLDVAAGLRIPGHWGLDIGVLTDVFARCDTSEICQVAVARSYDHKHQRVHADDSTRGLRRMAIDVTATIIGHLKSQPPNADVLCRAHLRAADQLIHHYANDAAFNGYEVDVARERAIARAFSHSIADAVEQCRSETVRGNRNASWRTVFEKVPEVAPMLTEALSVKA